MISIDQQAYRSGLKMIDPLLKIIIALSVSFITLIANSYQVSAIVILFTCWAIVKYSGTDLKSLIKLMMIPLSFLLLGVLTILIQKENQSGNLLLPIKIMNAYYGISLQQLDQAGRLIFKSMAAVTCMYFIALTTPMTSLFHAFRRLKIPNLFIELMELMYRFVFVLLQTAKQMYTAQSSRLGHKNKRTSLRSLGILGAMLFTRAYQKSDRIYIALASRGYEGELNFTETEYQNNFYFNLVSILFIFTLLFLMWLESMVIA